MRKLEIDSLPNEKEWVDADIVILHACFQILQDCVEKEKVDLHCNYEAHKFFVDEVRKLHQWWLNRKNSTVVNHLEDSEMLRRLMNIRLSLWT